MLVGLAAARGGEWGVGGGGEVVRSSAEVGGLGRSLDVTLGKSFTLFEPLIPYLGRVISTLL